MKLELIVKEKIKNRTAGLISQQQAHIDSLKATIENSVSNKLRSSDHAFRKSVAQLDALSPLGVLSRGYCIPEKENSVVSLTDLNEGDKINLVFSAGNAECVVDKIVKENCNA